MLSPDEIRSFLDQPPCPEDVLCSLDAGAKLPPGFARHAREAMALGRKFVTEVVRGKTLSLDRLMHQEPDHLAWEFVEEANRWGLYSQWIPKFMGGGGAPFPSLCHFLEEVGAECLSMANLLGVHYLGVATLCGTWNLPLISRITSEVWEGQKSGRPCLISLALTEPGAGTDVEEIELLDKGEVCTRAKRVKGGYVLDGSKVFISNGHLSTWHMVVAYEDPSRPSETMVVLAVKTGMPGFSFGRVERKMGQKACPASQLMFDGCFVPDELVGMAPHQISGLKRSVRKTNMQFIDYVFGASRAGVCAFGAAAARGALEEALQFAANTEVDGQLLVNHEWAQCLLAEMVKNVNLARLAYMEANYACGMYGIYKPLQAKPLSLISEYTPRKVLTNTVGAAMGMDAATRIFRRLMFDGQTDREIKRTSGWGSLAKVVGTDLGVKNAHLALELMGMAGLRGDSRAQKHLRDAKLLQIYEGSNQLNRLNVFNCLAADACKGHEPFSDVDVRANNA
ncbi:MAG: acyl-CoA/acyl-ACP dehydrogenase [Deltaproteobacteria bacterium]|nr:acyl-CoA/acyl-ACP dehydrogenase [Deltaproteobacteria bacterium]